MKQDKFSLARLAMYGGCSKSFISHLLSERRTSCTPELAERLAMALRVPCEVLFEPKSSPTGGATVNRVRKVSA
ncbi:XRE family transcriptional regulator [Rhodococcus jostii]